MPRNQRIVLAGAALLLLTLTFFLVMLSMAPRSNNPVELMQIVGTVCGVVGGLAVATIAIGALKKPRT